MNSASAVGCTVLSLVQAANNNSCLSAQPYGPICTESACSSQLQAHFLILSHSISFTFSNYPPGVFFSVSVSQTGGDACWDDRLLGVRKKPGVSIKIFVPASVELLHGNSRLLSCKKWTVRLEVNILSRRLLQSLLLK